MEGITLGEVAVALAFIAALLTGGKYLINSIKSGVSNLLKDEFETLNKKLKAINERIDDLDKKVDAVDTKLDEKINNVDMESCKNFLVLRLSSIERGDMMSEVELERFWEQYDYYRSHDGNSYIRHKIEQLERDGRLKARETYEDDK